MASESKTCEHINEEAIRDVQKFQLEYLKEEEYEDFYPLGARGISKPHSGKSRQYLFCQYHFQFSLYVVHS